MPHLAVYDMAGEKTGELDVPDELLGLPYNPDLVHQAVVAVDWQRKRHCGKAKTRGEVSRTSAKWYRQKGTGRARHGDRGAPLFVGGGVAHGPTGEQRRYTIPKRMRRKAVLTALSARAREGALTVVDELKLETISTKRFAAILAALELQGRILMLLSTEEAADEVLYKSARNVEGLVAREVPHFNTRDVLWADNILMTRAALAQMMGGGADSAL